ncbi:MULTISPECIES: DUF2642 domain-containing protein [unclassified Bacillus (in: firmicutes)]|uniref:DUF2642 domain-containing protein n=1 Tax=unclassified Bacillus (in: firmicutes) TaxID=185979 RepID=UPI0008EA382A|nr:MULTISPECIES: DUF2642 domain-containing protein [unclassified Bacillus (in: firmicutes)]SFA71955.1 hypothetical protein SAMN02799634_101254 [Bacillus sp. UNCCL13]SFQ62253.1 hypothetical protein SAMN04488577_0534 [Bacillus sp. cl95]
MKGLSNLLGKEVEIEISGKTSFSGILIDFGQDIIVIFNGNEFLYIPILHLQFIKQKAEPEITQIPPEDQPIQNITDPLSYRKTLNNAKGQFVEIFVTGNRSIHGYITSVLNDYIVFYSPIYKLMFISMHHLKWLTPYSNSTTPYSLNHEELPVMPSNIPLARSFDEQLQKYIGKLIVFDMGDHPEKIGVFKGFANNILQLTTANGETVYWKLMHLKSVHLP